jgi:6-phosphofructokinase 1
MTKRIGLLTSGGDSPGINAAIRGLGKASHSDFNIEIIGFQDGFSGMADDMHIKLEGDAFSGILTDGGTILGTNRDQPEKMLVNGQIVDRTQDILNVYKKHKLDGLVVFGGSQAQSSAHYLQQQGLKVITLPVTIDNDIPFADSSVGFDTAIGVAAEAIDRLHSTAISHHRIIIVEMMGRDTGWLTLAAGIAGGADVVLIPEIPYQVNKVAAAVLERAKAGKRFSLIAVSEGAISQENVRFFDSARKANERIRTGQDVQEVAQFLNTIEKRSAGDTNHLANQLEQATQLETRVTILGYLQRGGTPSASDRVLATQLGTACAAMINANKFGVMVASQSGIIVPAPLEDVAGNIKYVPKDHAWIHGARLVGVSLGD